MSESDSSFHARVTHSLSDIPAADWDACAGTGNPFLTHAFLSALEESGCVSAETGWQPFHILLSDEDGHLHGAVPLYLKNHSFGEYVFDWGWADAYERAGGQYYPKLQCGVPFTPVTGPRLLTGTAEHPQHAQRLLISALSSVAEQTGVSSLHVTFPTRNEWDALTEAGFLARTGQQYHWYNHGYADFDDFLATLSSRKRKNIRKERARVRESGITLRALSGEELHTTHWEAFYRFYMDTTDRKWGQPYLSLEFFLHLSEKLADRIVLILAYHDDQPVAGALNLRDDECLYGRNWGCAADFRFLHFEACYYQAIDYAISHGLSRVEAGAQGEHKIQRGYLPVETYSAHLIRDPALREAVESYLKREREMVRHTIDHLQEESPYRRENSPIPDRQS
ncbi:GNAT family N-acetyltransferase [Fodinicurvata halophila]|uniref:GNAT family N-acetyltransferase n=1 Tax=Fodinicurvata halophila TaxID=1419723 RepID=A0ABV8UIX1_9PROT